MEKLKGQDVVNSMTQNMRAELENLSSPVCLAIVRVGEKPDDISYERGAKKRMEKIGIECRCYTYPEDISDAEFKREFAKINAEPTVNGILLLRPLPKHIDENAVCNMIDFEKDVDCINPVNIEKVFVNDNTGFLPCTAAAVMKCLEFANVELAGKNVTIVGRSLVVGKPLSMLMLAKNATVTICHSKTRDLKAECKRADILVSCMGRAKMIDAEYVKEGAVVIDVGINVDENGNLCGDIDFDSVAPHASLITPVPGGVGSVTTAVLAEQTIKAARMYGA